MLKWFWFTDTCKGITENIINKGNDFGVYFAVFRGPIRKLLKRLFSNAVFLIPLV